MEGMYVQHVERNHLLSLPRLLNNRMLELRQQFLSRPKKNREQMVNLRQNLFGGSDKKENLTFAQEELDKMTQADSKRWNFDINAGKPMEGHYQWEQFTPETNQALDTSGRLTCLTTFAACNNNNNTSPSNGNSAGFASSSQNIFESSSSSSPTTTSSPNHKRAVTTTIFSTTTTPTAVISKKCVKRLQKSASNNNHNNNNKVPKLITDYFKETKPVSIKHRGKDMFVAPDEKDSVSNRMVDILKIRSMNVR